MFDFFRRSSRTRVDLSGLVADMHSHLIPGIDDGSPDIETSLEMIRALYDLGYRKLITTPHVQWEMYKNTPEIIQKGIEQLREGVAATEMKLELRGAAEYFLDEYLDEQLAADKPLLTLKDNLVLVEFSFIRQPMDLKDKIFQLQIKGYQPVIAHPERYLFFGAQKSAYDELKNMGCLFQLNLLSLCGYYGKKQVELASYLIKKNYVNLLGSDVHNLRHLGVLKNANATMATASRLLDAGVLLNPTL